MMCAFYMIYIEKTSKAELARNRIIMPCHKREDQRLEDVSKSALLAIKVSHLY